MSAGKHQARWTPPPNWPPPPAGWSPPQGWQSDPAWGPAPPGWNFYPDDRSAMSSTTLKIVAGLIGLLFFGGCVSSLAGEDAEDTVTQGAPAPTALTTPSPHVSPPPSYAGAKERDKVAAPGTAVDLSDWTTTTTPLTQTSDVFDRAVICSNVTLVNRDDEQQEYSSWSWKLQSPNGSVVDATYAGGEDDLESAGLAPGGTVVKRVCFEDEGVGAGPYVLHLQQRGQRRLAEQALEAAGAC